MWVRKGCVWTERTATGKQLGGIPGIGRWRYARKVHSDPPKRDKYISLNDEQREPLILHPQVPHEVGWGMGVLKGGMPAFPVVPLPD